MSKEKVTNPILYARKLLSTADMLIYNKDYNKAYGMIDEAMSIIKSKIKNS